MNKKPLPPEITAALTADPLLIMARDLGQIDDADYKSLDELQPQRTGDQKGSERWLKQDRARVAGEQDYEVRYEAKKTGKSKKKLKRAVKKVGSSRKKVERRLSR